MVTLSLSVAMCRGVRDQGVQCRKPGRQITQAVSRVPVYRGESGEDNQTCCPSNRSTVKLMLRKVQYAPEGEGVAPSVETTRDFVMSDKPLHVKASLDKEVSVLVDLWLC